MIRKANDKDFEQLVYVDGNSGLPFYEQKPEYKKGIAKWLKPLFENTVNEFYVYEENKKIVGFVALKKDFSAPNSCELELLAVLKEEHGKGIGKTLTQFIEKRAEELKFERIFLYTGEDNIPAQHFYVKNCYKKINEFPEYYSWGDTAVLYGKKLKENVPKTN